MTPTTLSTLSPLRYPVAATAVRLKPASTRTAPGATPWAGLTRPAAAATGHPSSGPEDRTNKRKLPQPARALPSPFDQTESSDAPVQLAASTIDAIARRILELIDERVTAAPKPPALIDAAELARRTGLSRVWIYEHAKELGAIRFGDGPRARLRFQPEAIERLREDRAVRRPPTSSARTRRPQSRAGTDVELLPIRRSSPRLFLPGLLRRRSH
jgi:hypothetical protein